ncbi:helix-turn-helix domain-containing protein [Thermophilibacter sp.]
MILGMGPSELAIMIPLLLIRVLPWVLMVVLAILAIRWFLRQERASRDPETVAQRRSLGEVLRAHRERCHMTQELVAEKVGVSRQAVSKWEQGTSEPSTTNLVKLARLYGVDPADLLREVGE